MIKELYCVIAPKDISIKVEHLDLVQMLIVAREALEMRLVADHVVALQADSRDTALAAVLTQRVPDTVGADPDDVAARLVVRLETQADGLAV